MLSLALGGARRPLTRSFGVVPTSKAFAGVPTRSLLRSYLVLWLCSKSWLTSRGMRALKFAEAVVGPKFTHAVLKKTLFKQFVAGESAFDITPTVEHLNKVNVRCILDYAVEDGVNDQTPPSDREWDENMESFLKTIRASQQHKCMVAVKATAIGSPELLLDMTSIIDQSSKMFSSFDVSGSGKITLEEFSAGIKRLDSSLDPAMFFSRLDVNNDGVIDYLDWSTYLAPSQMHVRAGPFLPHLSETQREALRLLEGRLNGIAEAASVSNVHVLIDAEQTYLQSSIDVLVTDLQRKFNTGEKCTISGTYQAYRKDCARRLRLDIERAKREGYRFSAKLVRGAYMTEERRRAAELGYPDPINQDVAATTAMVIGCVNIFFDSIDHADLMLASHNADSIKYVTNRMDQRQISPSRVKFAQLLGMADHVTNTLAANGYATFKYVPFGPIGKVVPYLLRRAEENSVVNTGTTRERRFMLEELRDRFQSALPFGRKQEQV